MLSYPKISPRFTGQFLKKQVLVPGLVAIVGLLLFPATVLAHHPFGGQTPDNFVSGFLSGLGHPVIGLDHLMFVIAAGLLAAVHTRGLAIPIVFGLTSLLGTGMHLMSVDLPAQEVVIALSVLAFGGLLATKQSWTGLGAIALGAMAGVFHGYAYGEAIVGARMTAMVAYLAGFTVVQLAIAISAAALGRQLLARKQAMPELPLRFAGFAIFGVGFTFLSALLMG